MRKFLVLVIDILIIYLSILVSFYGLNELDYLIDYQHNIGAFYSINLAIIPIYFVIAYIFGMTNLQRKSVTEVLYTVFLVSLSLVVSMMATIYIAREMAVAFPRSVVLVSFVIIYFSLSLWRILVQKIYTHRHGKRSIIIIGENTDDICNIIKLKYRNFYEIKYIISESDEDLEKKLAIVNDVFVSDDISLQLRDKLLRINNQFPSVNLFFIPRIADISIINSKLFPFGDLPIHVVKKLYLRPEEKFVKRMMDIFFSLFGLILGLPIFLLISMLIKLDGGSIFFKQERLTRDRKVFEIIKFRTMIPDAERYTGATLSTKKDPRITRIGHFLRITRLDELPQLWNILIGDMSLVGPRPERPIFAEKIEAAIPEFSYRLNVKAGLTGFAQIMGKYNTDFKQKLQYDLYYINNFSIFRDILILVQTIKVIFWKENVEGVEIKNDK